MVALDTNVLVYAHRREAREYAAASGLVRAFAEGSEPWGIPWPCVYEFFSVVTNRRIWKDAASTPEQAYSSRPGSVLRLCGCSARPRAS